LSNQNQFKDSRREVATREEKRRNRDDNKPK
jgi:hypothetical protein